MERPAWYGSIRPYHYNGDLASIESEAEFMMSPHFPMEQEDSPPVSSHCQRRYPQLTKNMLKVFVVACMALALWQENASAWNNMPKNLFQKAMAMGGLSAALASAPLTVQAIDFTGSYADPFHPNCLREVRVVSPFLADVTGTDGTPGCPPDGSGREWSLIGKIDGDSILIDFTPKGGPKDLKGVWEPSPVPGIRFPDGNLWSKKATVQ